MKKRLEQLLNGTFEYEVPSLVLSQSFLTLTLTEGEKRRGELYFAAEDDRPIRGMLVSDHRRILLSEDHFAGRSVRIVYEIDTAGLKEGQKIEGKISILSDIGEIKIPVKCQIHKSELATSQGALHSLADFVELAKRDFREAFRLFTSDYFPSMLPADDLKLSLLYKGLSQNPVTHQDLEEFLLAAGLKDQVLLSLDKTSDYLENLEGTVKNTLFIQRSGWGYVQGQLEVEGDFLQIEKKVVSQDDFIGSMFGLDYLVLREKLGKGKHYGRIILHTVYGDQVCQIVASAREDYEISIHTYERETRFDLTRSYLNRCLHLIDYRQWKEETMAVLTRLKDTGNYGLMHQLCETWVWLEDDDSRRAFALTDMLKNRDFLPEEGEEEGLYLWLLKRLDCEKDETAEKLRTLYRRNPDSLLLLHIILHEDDEYRNSPLKQLDLMEQQFERGCTSPILYYEAWEILKKDENFLKKLTGFMIQTLSFALRYGLMTPEMALRVGHIGKNEKVFRESVYRLLCKAWEVNEDREILETICKLAMLGNPSDRRHFKWYALAVDEDIRITRLYEYYVETLSTSYQASLPKAIQLYFSFTHTLSGSRKAAVYARIIKGKEKDPEMYRAYEPTMHAFALESLRKGSINEDYAVLYRDQIDRIDDIDMGYRLMDAIFSYRIYCDDPKVRNVIVCHPGIKEEEVFSCRDGVAYVPMYSRDAMVLFEDARQQRYAVTVDYNQQKLMDETELAGKAMAMGLDHPGLLLYACGAEPEKTEITISNLACFSAAAESDAFYDNYRHEIRKGLLDYYDTYADQAGLDHYLKKLDYDEFYQADPLLLQDILIRHDFFKASFRLIEQYGYEDLDPNSLFRLARNRILETEFAENEELVFLTAHVVKLGIYDEVLLTYLKDSYMGPVSDLVQLWDQMKGFSMDTYTLEEEILLIAMFTRVNIPKLARILESYVKARGRDLVIDAMLTFLSFGYFLEDIRIDMFVFRKLEALFEKQEPLDIICQLALLKRYRFSKKLNQYQKENVKAIMRKMKEEKLRFAFFQELPEELIRGYQLEDKSFVEAYYPPGEEVTLHYAICHGDEEPPVYRSEPQRHRYHGLFSREFLLFYGEKLQYYLTVGDGEREYRTEVKTILPKAPGADGNTKYEIINQLMAAYQLGKETTGKETIKKYRQMEALTSRFFGGSSL